MAARLLPPGRFCTAFTTTHPTRFRTASHLVVSQNPARRCTLLSSWAGRGAGRGWPRRVLHSKEMVHLGIKVLHHSNGCRLIRLVHHIHRIEISASINRVVVELDEAMSRVP